MQIQKHVICICDEKRIACREYFGKSYLMEQWYWCWRIHLTENAGQWRIARVSDIEDWILSIGWKPDLCIDWHKNYKYKVYADIKSMVSSVFSPRLWKAFDHMGIRFVCHLQIQILVLVDRLSSLSSLVTRETNWQKKLINWKWTCWLLQICLSNRWEQLMQKSAVEIFGWKVNAKSWQIYVKVSVCWLSGAFFSQGAALAACYPSLTLLYWSQFHLSRLWSFVWKCCLQKVLCFNFWKPFWILCSKLFKANFGLGAFVQKVNKLWRHSMYPVLFCDSRVLFRFEGIAWWVKAWAKL